MAVTTDWLPSGSVDVCTTTLVWAAALTVLVDVVIIAVGVMVEAPPPTVDIMTTPEASVEVTTWPVVRELELPVVLDGTLGVDVLVVVGTTEVDGGVEIGIGALVEVVLIGVVVIGVSTAELTVASMVELAEVGVSGCSGTGVTRVEVDSGSTTAADVVVAVPLLISSCRLTKSTISDFWRLAMFTMLVAIDGSSLWMTSTAVRSSGNMPCLNFLGEKV